MRRAMSMKGPTSRKLVNSAQDSPITDADLIPDEALAKVQDDRLRHGPIADRVADIIATVKYPTNIALFGPWGSGKSSFGALLSEKLSGRNPKPQFVHYSTWRFKGEPLQRNFISYVATTLGHQPKKDGYSPYHEGLYEDRQDARVGVGGARRGPILTLLGVFFTVLFLAVLTVGLAIGILAQVFGKDPVSTAKDFLPALIVPSVLGSILVALATGMIGSMTAHVMHSAPTQEQLRDRFRELLKELRKRGTPIVFYIDELDRCSASDVVETLGAIRNFFDEPDCVFVVAADKDALIAGLRALPQGTPQDEHNPYRSTATEFLDKVFQFQISLPPLRGPGIATFAQSLVEGRGGIWAELREHGQLDAVILVLIPSHVRSPRHVKVLLNNFVANYRIAASRGLNALARATEIAKLTVFQTEFPLFVPYLLLEPNLPAMILAAEDPSAETDDAEATLVARFLPGSSEPEVAGTPPRPANVLVPVSQRVGDASVWTAIHAQFRSYLTRVREYPSPARDLLYMEPVAETVELENDDIGRLIEDHTVDNPGLVTTTCTTLLAPTDRPKAVLLLGQLAAGAARLERSKYLTVLLGVAESMGYQLSGPAREAAWAVITQVEHESGLEPEQEVPSFTLALRTDNADLMGRLLEKTTLLADAGSARELALLSDELPDEERSLVRDAVGRHLDVASTWMDPLAQLTEATALEMLQGLEDIMADNLQSVAVAEEAPFATHLIEALDSRDSPSDEIVELAIVTILLGSGLPSVYEVVRDNPVHLASPAMRFRIALAAMSQAPAGDWSTWLPSILQQSGSKPDQALALDALDHVFEVLGPAASSAGNARETVAALVAIAGSSAPKPEAVSAYAGTALGPWATMVVGARQVVLGCLMELRRFGGEVAPAAEASVVDDLVTGLSSVGSFDPATATAPMFLSDLSRDSLNRLGGQIVATMSGPQQASFVRFVPSAVRLQSQIARAAAFQAPDATTSEDLLPGYPQFKQVLDADPTLLPIWLEARPPVAHVIDLATSMKTKPVADQEQAFARWNAVASLEDRTMLLLKVLGEPNLRWLFDCVRGDEATLVAAVSARVRKATTAPERQKATALLNSIEPKTAVRLDLTVELVEWILAQNAKIDVRTASQLVDHLPGDSHQHDKRIAKAFVGRELDDLSRSEKDALRRHGVQIAEKPKGLGRFRFRS
jgi:hypothetical protein